MTYQECKTPECGNLIFAGGLCRKHYERERLATASPCSFFGCKVKSFRAGLCEPHYRAKVMSLRPLCSVPNCGSKQKNLSLKLCQKHEFRVRNHGTIEQQRSPDWGSREVHPMYSSWTYHKRLKPGLVQEWRDDFWMFVKAVGEKPAGFTLRRKDKTQPLGPTNWLWKESIIGVTPAKYQQQWRKRNPEKDKNNNLKQTYGLTLEQYKEMGEAQQWRCAICNGLETTLDKDGGPRQMPVDHDHKTGKIRALLCTQCNRGLGFFKDSAELLKAASEYLIRLA